MREKDNIQVYLSEMTPKFFNTIPEMAEMKQERIDKSYMVDLYNKITDIKHIDNLMHQQFFVPYFKSFKTILKCDGKKYSFFQILKIYA